MITYWQLIDKDCRWLVENFYVGQCSICGHYYSKSEHDTDEMWAEYLLENHLTASYNKTKRKLNLLHEQVCVKCANRLCYADIHRSKRQAMQTFQPIMSSSSVVPLCQIPVCPACGTQCKHGMSSKPGENFGREFWTCPNSKPESRMTPDGKRHLFAWKSAAASAVTAPTSPVVQATHDSTLNGITDAIKQLAMRVANLETLINHMQAQNAATQAPTAQSQFDINALING